MRLATWNVNSVRTRVDRIIAFLERENVDALAMQETKCRPEQFPLEAFTAAGYEVAVHGLNQWNGVAIASRSFYFCRRSILNPNLKALLKPFQI